MKVYISGPMTGVEGFNYPAFHAMEARLLAQGRSPVNPAHNFGGRTDLSRADYMRMDLSMLLQCDAIVFLPGWEKSEGAQCERQVAAQIGLTVLTIA